jgi:FixJ family two-component response regulator
MPGMTGGELYACLIQAGHRIPTILVTAYPDEATRARTLKDGIACYLLKPFDDNDLMDCVRNPNWLRTAARDEEGGGFEHT